MLKVLPHARLGGKPSGEAFEVYAIDRKSLPGCLNSDEAVNTCGVREAKLLRLKIYLIKATSPSLARSASDSEFVQQDL
jgi:hypothetical protein